MAKWYHNPRPGHEADIYLAPAALELPEEEFALLKVEGAICDCARGKVDSRRSQTLMRHGRALQRYVRLESIRAVALDVPAAAAKTVEPKPEVYSF